MSKKTLSLSRALGPMDAASLVVGTIIGTGIFLKPAAMAHSTGSAGMVLLAWVVAGLLSLIGALTYAELGARVPDSGGEYAYLREAYGKFPAFLFGWMRFWIGSAGSIAAYAVGSAAFLSAYRNLADFPGGDKGVALFFIAVFTALNCFKVTVGGHLQAALTGLKVFLVLGITLGLFFWAPAREAGVDTSALTTGSTAFGAAVLAALWAYDGWNSLPMVGEEVRDPQRNIPLALILGIFVVIAIYLAINLGYFSALSFAEVSSGYSSVNPDAPPVATMAVQKFLGDSGASLLSLVFVISALGAMNGAILTGARVPFAMARDGLFFSFLARVNTQSRVPVFSVVVQGIWSMLLALSGSFDQLTDWVVFASWIFYALTASAVFVFRSRSPKAKVAYQTWGYPWVPAGFILSALVLLVNTVWNAPRETGYGLLTIAAGVPFYLYFSGQKKKRGT